MNIHSFIDVIGVFGGVVFAISGALAAKRHRMDPIGFVLLGTLTAIGGGTIRDLLLNRPVSWTQSPGSLVIAMTAALATYFFDLRVVSAKLPTWVVRKQWTAWFDAAGLSAFAVQGTAIALSADAPSVVAAVMGVMTAVGGGVLRDILSGDRPMIISGQLYASTAAAGTLALIVMLKLGSPQALAAAIGFLVVFVSRGVTIRFDIRMGPPGESLRIGKVEDERDAG